MNYSSILLDFQNDALATASNIMCPIWNGAYSDAYTLSNMAANLIDRVKIYDVEKYANQPIQDLAKHMMEKIQSLTADYNRMHSRETEKILVFRFIQRWQIRIEEMGKCVEGSSKKRRIEININSNRSHTIKVDGSEISDVKVSHPTDWSKVIEFEF